MYEHDKSCHLTASGIQHSDGLLSWHKFVRFYMYVTFSDAPSLGPLFFFWGGQFYWGTWTYALRRKQDHSNLFPTPDTFVWVPKKVLLVDLCIDLLHWGHMRISSAMACHFGESKCMWKFAELVNASTVPKMCITQQHMSKIKTGWGDEWCQVMNDDVRWSGSIATGSKDVPSKLGCQDQQLIKDQDGVNTGSLLEEAGFI